MHPRVDETFSCGNGTCKAGCHNWYMHLCNFHIKYIFFLNQMILTKLDE